MYVGREAHIKLLGMRLERAVAQMFLCSRLAPAEWDIDENLREAFQEEDCLEKMKKMKQLSKHFDEIINVAQDKKFNIPIDNKYLYLYKLIN